MKHDDAVRSLAVEQYLLGEMQPEERDAFEEHYFECSICAEELKSASSFMEDARAVLAVEPSTSQAAEPIRLPVKVSPSKSGSSWLAWLQPQTAAFALAGIMVVSAGTIATLWRQLDQFSSPRLIEAALLKGQTRGTAPVLQATAGAPALLVFDLPDVSASRLHYLVESSSGEIVFQLSGNTPPPGEQVNLFVPKLDLPAGDFRLLVRAEGAEGQDVAQYPFQVSVGKEAN